MNEFNEIRKIEQEREMVSTVKVILAEVQKLNQAVIEIKKSQTLIRHELRNLDKLRPLKVMVEEE